MRTILVVALAYLFALQGLLGSTASARAGVDNFSVVCAASLDGDIGEHVPVAPQPSGHAHECVVCALGAFAAAPAVTASAVIAFPSPPVASVHVPTELAGPPPSLGWSSSWSSRAPPSKA